MMGQRSDKLMFWIVGFVIASLLGVLAYLQHPKFGRLAEGEHLTTIQRSPNYGDGEFRNLIDTPMFTEDKSFLSVLFENLRASGERLRPLDEIPAINTDLNKMDLEEDGNILAWEGIPYAAAPVGELRWQPPRFCCKNSLWSKSPPAGDSFTQQSQRLQQ